MITVLADRHIPFLEEFLPADFRILRYDPYSGFGDDLPHADALLIRTVNPINAQTITPASAPKLRFVATASAGFDHVDARALQECKIAFAAAEGCNAWSVGEFVAAALLYWCAAKNVRPETLRIGIIGAGHTGSAAFAILNYLGCSTVLYDPPRELREPESFRSATLEEVLACDVLSFHLPLTYPPGFRSPADQHKGKSRKHPPSGKAQTTWKWLDNSILSAHTFRLIINASRGEVVDVPALLSAGKSGRIGDFILDVWECEPDIDAVLAADAFLATPHIAGYSTQSKRNATRMVAEKMVRFFADADSGGKPPGHGNPTLPEFQKTDGFSPDPKLSDLNSDISSAILKSGTASKSEFVNSAGSDMDSVRAATAPSEGQSAWVHQGRASKETSEIAGTVTGFNPEIIKSVLPEIHPMFGMSVALKTAAAAGPSALREKFIQLRSHTPLRNEFRCLSADNLQMLENWFGKSFSDPYLSKLIQAGAKP